MTRTSISDVSIASFTAPTLQATGNLNAQSNGVTPATPVLPSSQANDILILLCFAQNTNTNFTTPTGYTEIIQLNAGAHKVAFFWKRHSGSESNPSVANSGWTNTNIMAAKVDAYRGCRTTGTPFESLAAAASSSGVLNGVPVKTTGVKRLALQLWGRLANSATAPDEVWTEAYDAGTSGGGGCRFYVDNKTQTYRGTVPAASRGSSGVAYGMCGLALIGDGPNDNSRPRTTRKGLWVWDFMSTVLGSANEQNILLNECVASGLTDLYCYSFSTDVVSNASEIRTFIARCSLLNIRVWGLDGSRTYFSDLDGPQQLYDDISAIVAYNAASAANERFYGFHMDIEPPDVGAGTTFHNGIASSALSTVPGSGDWQSTEALDREYLMRDWVSIHQAAQAQCHAAGLQLGTAITTFLDDYFGEPITCTYNSVTQNVFLHLAQYSDVIALMSYNTSPANVITRIKYELETALPSNSNVKIGFALETATGVGSGISYGDTSGKQTKAAMWADMATTAALYEGNPAYSWFNVHDWAGYKALSPTSSNTAAAPTSPSGLRVAVSNRAQDSPNVVFNGNFTQVPTVITAATNTQTRWIDGTAAGSTAAKGAGWSTVALTSSASAGFDTIVTYSGQSTMKLSTLDATGAATVGTYRNAPSATTLHELFTLLPSTQYILTGFVRTNNVATNGAFMDLREFGSTGSTLVTTSTNKLSGTDTSFRTVTLTLTTNASTRFGTVFLRNNVAGNISDAWFGGITLRRTSGLGRVAP